MSVAPDEPARFPYGYGRPPDGGPQGMGTMLTWPQMMQKKTVNHLHPEVLRRFYAMLHAAYNLGIPLGVGTGWRVQPDPPPPGFAKPGNSWHESCPTNPQSATALAIDTVPNVSWPWMEDHCASFGFRTFKALKEPWHIQPIEISASRKYATTPPDLYTWHLPDLPPVTGEAPPPVVTEPPPVVVTPPPTSGGTFTLELQKNELTPAKREQLRGNGDVYLIQQIAQGHFKQLGKAVYDCGKPDGDYGDRTQQAVKQMQADGGLRQDACCGNATWSYVLNKGGG